MSNANAFFNNNGNFSNIFDPSANATAFDPSIAFNSISPSNLDLQQVPNPQLQQRNQSPLTFNPSYHANPVIPAKRPRPTDDGIGTPPRTAPGTVDPSRSQTPQQGPYQNAFLGQHAGQSFQTPNTFQHLQQPGSAHATPSPTMQNQQFRPPGGSQQRVQTQSPRQFHPNMANFGVPQNNLSRLGTPQQQSNPNFMGGQHFDQQFGQTSQANAGMIPGSMSFGRGLGPHPQAANSQYQDMQRRYQMRMQQQAQEQLQANQMQSQNRQPGNPMNSLSNGQMMGANGSMPNRVMQQQQQQHQQQQQLQQQQQQQQQQRQQQQHQHQQQQQQQLLQHSQNPSAKTVQEQNFLKVLQSFLQARGQMLNPDIRVAGRPINLYSLFAIVQRAQSSKRVTSNGGWPHIAQQLGIPVSQFPSAGDELRGVFEQYLGAYEAQYYVQMQKRRMSMQQQNQQGAVPGVQQQISPQNASFMMGGPGSQSPPPPQQQSMNLPNNTATPPHSAAPTAVNGFSPPQAKPQSSQPPQTDGFAHQKSASRTLGGPGLDQSSQWQLQTPPRAVSSKGGAKAEEVTPENKLANNTADSVAEQNFNPEYSPQAMNATLYGGIDVKAFAELGESLRLCKADIPSKIEAGLIDVRALTLSVSSGIHGEMRYALDQLVRLSFEFQFQDRFLVDRCEELVEALVDCAEEQSEILAANPGEPSDVINLECFEHVSRAVKAELDGLQDHSSFASSSYEFDRAADRILAVTRILRNLSEVPENQSILSGSSTMKCLTHITKLLGTRQNFLRKASNVHDFMEDMVIFLSNTAHLVEIPSKADALVLLHFLLAFAPYPPPIRHGKKKLRFYGFDPAKHQQLPAAVDALAKLLARDDPNRMYYRAIFHADASSTTPYQLLTGAFALAISPAPQWPADDQLRSAIRISTFRNPFFSQGMLAADILASLAPGQDNPLVRSWLESEDGFAPNLLRLAQALAVGSANRRPPQVTTVTGFENSQGFDLLTHSALSMLTRLAEKTHQGKDAGLLARILPIKETVLKALSTPDMEPVALNYLCALTKFEK